MNSSQESVPAHPLPTNSFLMYFTKLLTLHYPIVKLNSLSLNQNSASRSMVLLILDSPVVSSLSLS